MPRLVALLVLLAALAVPAVAQAAPPSTFGVQVASPSIDVPVTEVRRQLDIARRAGAGIVRLQALWAQVEPHPGQFSAEALARVDDAVLSARRRGMRVLLLFGTTPCWASLSPEASDCTRYGPRDPLSAIPAATMLARRYAEHLVAFQIWNEPDHVNELYWKGPDKVSRYVALTRALYGPLKQAAPSVPVLAGSFVGMNGRWLEALYREGFKGTYDALSVHFYDLTLYGLRETRKVMREYDDASPLWLAETGWSSCASRARTQLGHLCVTRTAQAALTRSLIRALRRDRRVHGVVFFTARDSAAFDFGFVDRAGRRKPIERVFRREVKAPSAHPVPRPRISVRARRGRLHVTGTGPSGDVFRVTARAPRVRYAGYTRLNRRGRISFWLPRELGTRGVRVAVRHQATGRTGARTVR